MPARGRLGSGSSPEHMPYSGPVPEPIAVAGGLGSGSSPEHGVCAGLNPAHVLYSGLVPEPSAPRRHRTARAARPMSVHFNSDLKKAFV